MTQESLRNYGYPGSVFQTFVRKCVINSKQNILTTPVDNVLHMFALKMFSKFVELFYKCFAPKIAKRMFLKLFKALQYKHLLVNV